MVYRESHKQHHQATQLVQVITPPISYPEFTMRPLQILCLSIFTIASAQTYRECTAEVARTDDCAAVINANACYNKFRWNSQTLTCIDGDDNAVKQKQVCGVRACYDFR